MKKNLIILILVLLFSKLQAQQYKNQIKGNLLLAPIGMVNVGYEHMLSQHWTGQIDIFISPWKSFSANRLLVYMGHLEARYYFLKAMKKWYLGANIGMATFNMQKWNYRNTSLYQEGFNYMIGATVGYQLLLNDHWSVDIFIGGGNSQGFYHGWDESKNPPERYDDAPNGWDKSGEWIPYRGGLMISYKF
ncbi:DUF3575 domain-containing protein [Elizabethkingia anophelis]|uniref:DUF3575 domain-containing protein n=1 Tax=Elizabethkingia anophelis TaxID=1117645 RepID=UPI00136CBF71|nr:DUF3575 domain-containing protein [Elizabethkingia anophelis]MYY27373.1 DUF3575 domain-containing protein [Elizabethkingia anophelis]